MRAQPDRKRIQTLKVSCLYDCSSNYFKVRAIRPRDEYSKGAIRAQVLLKMSKAKTYNYQECLHLAALYRYINCSTDFKVVLLRRIRCLAG